MKFLLIGMVIIFNLIAHLLFKFASSEIVNIDIISLISNWKIVVGGIIQLLALLTWIKLLQSVDLYWAGLMTAIIPLGLVLIGIVVFGEIITLTKVIGTVLIVFGLIIIN